MLPAKAQALLALPPRRFVAERDALARELAAEHDPAASTVRRLRRPVGLAWVMNRLARERADDVQALLAAGDRLRTAQRRAMAGRGAADLRAADAGLRESARALRLASEPIVAERGRPGSPSELARLELLLRIAATAPGAVRDALLHGALEGEPQVATPDLSGFTVVAGGAAPPERARPAAGPERRREAHGPAGGEGLRTRLEHARAERDRVRRERAERERKERERAKAIAAARRELSRAEAGAARAERAASAAEARARETRSRADAARREAEERRAKLRALEGSLVPSTRPRG